MAAAARPFHGGFRPAGARPFVHVPRAVGPTLGVSGRVGVALRPPADHHRRVLGFGLGGPYVYGTFYPLDAAAQTVVVNNSADRLWPAAGDLSGRRSGRRAH